MIRLLPNALTLSRMPLAMSLLYFAAQANWATAAILFFVGLATDFLDGAVARRLKVTSTLGGQVLEPICDLALAVAGVIGLLMARQLSLRIACGLAALTILLYAANTYGNQMIQKHAYYLHPLFYIAVICGTGLGYLALAMPTSLYAYIVLVYAGVWCVVGYAKRQRVQDWFKKL